MHYAQVPRVPGAHRAGLVVVVALHALLGLALMQGLARTVIEVFKPPVNARVLQEPKPVDEPPPNLPRPQAVSLPQSVAAVPDVVELAAPPDNTLSARNDTAPAGPAGNAGTGTSLAAPASVPSSPRMAARPAIGDVQSCAPRSDDYPLAARRAEAAGTTRLRFTVSAAGSLLRSEVVRSAGPTREHRLLDKMAESKLAHCSFSAGADENGNPVGGTFEVDYVWKLEY